MSVTKMAEIVRKLTSATDKGKVSWEETETENIFQVSYPTYSIRLSSIPSLTEPGEEDITIAIYNETGRKIESATDAQLDDSLDSAYQEMKKLHQMAKGYALGTEQTLDDIISELDPGIPF